MNFDVLVTTITQTHATLQQSAASAINRHLTIRNWLIGFYIVHFEQKGEDRAKYGEELIERLARKTNIKGLSARNLNLFRQFYVCYFQIGQAIPEQLRQLQMPVNNIDYQSIEIVQSVIAQLAINRVPPDKLISKLSYTHLIQLIPITDDLKRTFYEIECIKGNWSVRELSRQIDSLYYERSAMSQKPEKLSAMIANKAETVLPEDIIKSVYTFEFLGLHPKEVIEESKLETALLDHLQDFLLEMGHGFCLEARQKKILIGDEYFFVDIVFYHRILKCHILLELKMEKFNHQNAEQLNTYLSYYKKEVMQKDDHPPVGILLVANKNQALVEYATAGMDNQLFVSKYLVKLPDKKQLERFINEELKRL